MRRPRLTEAEFLAQVLALAAATGWRCLHIRPARTRRGWVTPVQGAGAVGFPDLLLIRGSVLLVAELKTAIGQQTAAQSAWLAAFRNAGIPAFLWRPGDWEEIERVLRTED